MQEPESGVVPIANEERLVLPDSLGTTSQQSQCAAFPEDMLFRRVLKGPAAGQR
jgi:hypothetical protein